MADVVISGSIVLYKSKNVDKAISSFLDSDLNIRLYLIDNSPTKQLEVQLREYIKDERVVYIYNHKNIGFGAAHNIAIQQCLNTSKYHLVLNPDITFKSGVLEALLDYLEKHTDVGLVQPKIVYPNGNLQYACRLLPTPADLIIRRFFPANLWRSRRQRFEMRSTEYNKEIEVPYLCGCFMFLRTEALKKAGLFDERFFMYPEDIDLTRRINKSYRTVFYPTVTVVHAHARGSYKNLLLLYIHVANMIKYFNKWGWIFDKERRVINKRVLSQDTSMDAHLE